VDLIEDTLANRSAAYSFDHATDYTSWQEFHDNITRASQDDNSNYAILVKCIHPHEYSHTNGEHYFCDLSYDDFSNYWLVDTKINWNNFPRQRAGELLKEHSMRTKYAHEIISIDNFLDLSTWEHEYRRLSELMGLVVYMAQATALIHSWHRARVSNQMKKFKQITEPFIHAEYRRRRLTSEVESHDSGIHCAPITWVGI
jgi:hypothetical protein